MDACVVQGVESATEGQEIIDMDEIDDVVAEPNPWPNQKHRGKRRAVQDVHKTASKQPCEGFHVTFPEGTNHHISYPFGIHSERPVPWNYRSVDDIFWIQAKSCQKSSNTLGGLCKNCQKLTSSNLFAGIIDRICHGTHENTPLMYHGVRALITIVRRKTAQIEELRMSKLNDTRKLLVKAGTLDDHKQWVLAVASGQVDRVASLVQAGLKQKMGI